VVFVYLGERFPKYASASLEIAEQFSGLDVTLLGNFGLRDKVKSRSIEFVPIEDFYNPMNFSELVSKIDMPLSFRSGFWSKTLERLFVLQQYMEFYKVQEIFHAELDQILFRCDKFLRSLEEFHFRGLALPFHTIDKGIASVLYCNDIKSLESLLSFAKMLPSFNNEMELIAQWAKCNPQMLHLLPTIASEEKKSDAFHSAGLKIISSTAIDGIVDAAQIGQWIGGQDPRNVSIRNSPTNKYVESPSEELLSYNELLNLDFKLLADGSLLVTCDKSKSYNLYNIHLHSKIHPWILKSHENLHRLLRDSNKTEAVVFPTSRWIQISDFIATGLDSVKNHPIEFVKRFYSRTFNLGKP
jgi:hypothetical protein